jgi:hypothetical protein
MELEILLFGGVDEIGVIEEDVYPFEAVAALYSKFVGIVNELGFGEVNAEFIVEEFAFLECVDLFEFLHQTAAIDKFLSIEVHFLEDSFDLVFVIVVFFLVDVAAKVVFVVWFPGFAAHIAEAFSAETSHEITTLRALDGFIAPGAEFGIGGYPLGVGFFLENHIDPFLAFLTGTRRVVIVFAPKAEQFATVALDGGD